ncbi:MAG: ATP-binding cassette domain-containing protein, partial [Planctomycetota bacterium]
MTDSQDPNASVDESGGPPEAPAGPASTALSDDAGAGAGFQPIIIRTINLKKAYQMGEVVTHALRGITVEILRGEFLCVMGPSGSGKSTFFNMVGGLDSPTGGRVFLDEVD